MPLAGLPPSALVQVSPSPSPFSFQFMVDSRLSPTDTKVCTHSSVRHRSPPVLRSRLISDGLLLQSYFPPTMAWLSSGGLILNRSLAADVVPRCYLSVNTRQLSAFNHYLPIMKIIKVRFLFFCILIWNAKQLICPHWAFASGRKKMLKKCQERAFFWLLKRVIFQSGNGCKQSSLPEWHNWMCFFMLNLFPQWQVWQLQV